MIWYLICINLITFLLYGLDKYNARKNLYRVSEYTLFVFSFFGGCIGAILGMRIFHHKTKKILFWALNIIFLILWLLFIFAFKYQ